MNERFDIDLLEADLGQAAALRVIANCGGQRRSVPLPRNAANSALATEIGVSAAIWISARFGGEKVEFPSRYGRLSETRAALLRADVLDAGLTNPVRSANDIAHEHGVTSRRVEQIRQELRNERRLPNELPLFQIK